MVLKEIQSTLMEMAVLLRLGSFADWSDAYEGLAQKIVASPSETSRQILASYGGMGSLNDVCLVRNGAVLQGENRQFDDLRSRLHTLCLQQLTGSNSTAER
jgi:hypothetical protein